MAVLMGDISAGKAADKNRVHASWRSPAAGLPGMPHPQAAGYRGDKKVELPAWIHVDAHLCYLSRSSGKVMEVIVEMVNHVKCEVEIKFVEDQSVWKVIPFVACVGDGSPILGPWKGESTAPAPSTADLLNVAKAEIPDKGEMIRRLKDSTASASGEVVRVRSQSRSRSPKPGADPS